MKRVPSRCSKSLTRMRRAARHPPRRGEPRFERRHVLRAFLQRIAGRDQPPHLVEAERAHRLEADVPVPAMRRIERAAEETDARHAPTASMRAAAPPNVAPKGV